MKVLIVDDEKKLCRLIEKLINWEKLGLELCGYRHDGMEALETIKNEKPNIVITDIRMPKCSGLELIEQIRKLGSAIHIIVISGYSDFEYAQTAIKFGVEDYLLKPIQKEELNHVLEKIVNREKEKYSKMLEKAQLEKALDYNSRIAKTNFLEKLLFHRESLDFSLDLNTFNIVNGCNFKEGKIQIAMVHFLTESDYERNRVIEYFVEKVITNNKIFDEGYYELLTYKNEYIYVFLINDSVKNNDFINRNMRKIRGILTGYKEILENAKIFFYTAGPIYKISEMDVMLQNLESASWQRFFSIPFSIIDSSEFKKEDWKYYVPEKFVDDFGRNIETFSIENLKKQVSELVEYMKEKNLKNGQIVRRVYKELESEELHRLKKNNIVNYEKLEKLNARLFRNCYDYKKVFVGFFDLLISFLDEILLRQHNENAKPIRLAKEFINQNYNEGLSLEIVGDNVGLSPVYLSSLFKKETGISFIDYITEVRIENSKRLLMSTDKTLVEIADSTGFCDTKYFSKIFKKCTGLSPSEFRKLYS